MRKPTTRIYQNKPFFRAETNGATLELLVYDEIGESWDGGGVTAAAVKQQIDAAPACSDILLRINSPGGDVFESIAIYNLLRAQKKPIEVRVDGLAASAASIIAMCGDTIVMGAGAMLMIHNAWTFCAGYAADMRQVADQLDKISGTIAKIYCIRTRRAYQDVVALMDEETWMTAQECLEAKFCTGIDEPDDQVESMALSIARRFRLLAKLNHVPDRFRASDTCACTCEGCSDGDCGNCTNANCHDENCVDCPMQDGGVDNLVDLELRLQDLDSALRF